MSQEPNVVPYRRPSLHQRCVEGFDLLGGCLHRPLPHPAFWSDPRPNDGSRPNLRRTPNGIGGPPSCESGTVRNSAPEIPSST